MAKKHLFFDLDDTLIKCSGYFYDIMDTVAYKFLEYDLDYSLKEIKELFDEIQMENIAEHGYGPDNFKYSLMQAGSRLLGYDFFKDNLAEFIENETKILYNHPIELIDGAEETIKYLYNKGYNLHILTKGSQKVQKDRVNKLPIKKYFDDYYIVKHKEKSDYEDILTSCKLSSKDCFMIGNSPKGDINEAKLAGFNTVYIPSADTWSLEDEKIANTKPKTYELDNILGLKNIF